MELIKPNVNTGFEIVNIPDDQIIIEFLKKHECKFNIINIDLKTREKLLSYNKIMNIPDEYNDTIVGYARMYKGKNFRSSGGLKLSSKYSAGAFIIEEEKIIYDATQRFYEERDAYVYSASLFSTYYTTSSMKELLLDELRLARDYYIYVGDKITTHPPSWYEELQSVSLEELLSYADSLEKGLELQQKIFQKKSML